MYYVNECFAPIPIAMYVAGCCYALLCYAMLQHLDEFLPGRGGDGRARDMG